MCVSDGGGAFKADSYWKVEETTFFNRVNIESQPIILSTLLTKRAG